MSKTQFTTFLRKCYIKETSATETVGMNNNLNKFNLCYGLHALTFEKSSDLVPWVFRFHARNNHGDKVRALPWGLDYESICPCELL